MTLSWTADVLPNRCAFWFEHNTMLFVSPLTRSQQVIKRAGDRWACTVQFRLSRAKAQKLDALLAQLKGSYGSVYLWDFARPTPTGANLDRSGIPDTYFSDATGFTDGTHFVVADATARVLGATAGASQVNSDRWMPSTTPLLAGDYIAIDNHCYILTQDAVANASGEAVLYIAPTLVQTFATGIGFLRSYCLIAMRLVDDQQPNRSVQVGSLYEYSLSFIEAK